VQSKEVVIVGAGPAGMSAAIQLMRSGIEPLLLEKREAGGLLLNANLVENYPGFPEGISGHDLVGLFKEHLQKTGVAINFEEVLELDYTEGFFFIKTKRDLIKSEISVIATGTYPKKIADLTLPDEVKERLFYEVYPIRRVKDKKIAIIGAGDAAFDYALTLSSENEVTVLNRSDTTRCLPILFDRSLRSKNISHLTNVGVRKIQKDTSGLKITAAHLFDGEEYIIDVDYVIVAIGREPCINFLGRGLKRNSNRLKKNHRLFMVGDVINGTHRQAVISVGDGVRAAMEIYETIRKEHR